MTDAEEELMTMAIKLRVSRELLNDVFGLLRNLKRVDSEQWKKLNVAFRNIDESVMETYAELRKQEAQTDLVCCWKCQSGKPMSQWFSKMILCKSCGNKRCPKATDHALECTNSNALGQHGSIYANDFFERMSRET